MISGHEFKPFSPASCDILRTQAIHCRSFTGDPKCPNKSLEIRLRDQKYAIEDIQALSNMENSLNMEFCLERGAVGSKKEICISTRLYQLSEQFGSAQLLAICPTYLLINDTSHGLRITQLLGSEDGDVAVVPSLQMLKLDF